MILTQLRMMLVLAFPSGDVGQQLHKSIQLSGFAEDEILQSRRCIQDSAVFDGLPSSFTAS